MKQKKKHFILKILILLFALLNIQYFHLNSLNTSLFYDSFNYLNTKKVLAKNNLPDDFSPDVKHLHPQWNHNVMNIGEAWADGYTGKGIKIAILDTGFFHQHPDISINNGYSVIPDDPWSNDHSGHGTHIAGIISAKKGSTYQGIAPDADIFAIKIYNSKDIDENGDVSTDTISVRKGIDKAIEENADIILISSGLSFHDEDIYKSIKKAYERNILIIAASGNGMPDVNFPARYEEVLAITALDEKLNPAIDIIYGKENNFSAPGVNIGGLSIPDSKYSYPYIFMSGSSQAAPHAAGLAAIYMQKYEKRGNDIKKIMKKQALPIGDVGLYGRGLLYYQSDSSHHQQTHEPIELDELDELAPPIKDLNDNEIDEEVKNPSTSKEADVEEKEELVDYHLVEIIQDEKEDHGYLPEDTLSLIEPGGTLEVLMNHLEKLILSEQQIAQIRENNIRINLKKDHVSWSIPPANFVSGKAELLFYEGVPIGVLKNEDAGPGAYTVSIHQIGTRKNSYPSEMEIKFDFKEIDYSKFETLRAYYWNTELDEWRWIVSEKDNKEDTFQLNIQSTSAVGFFDPNYIQEKKYENNQASKQKKRRHFFKQFFKVIGILGILFILFVSIKTYQKTK